MENRTDLWGERSPVGARPATGGRTRRRGEGGERAGCTGPGARVASSLGGVRVGGWWRRAARFGKGGGSRRERRGAGRCAEPPRGRLVNTRRLAKKSVAREGACGAPNDHDTPRFWVFDDVII